MADYDNTSQVLDNREHDDSTLAKRVVIVGGSLSSTTTYNFIQSEETATYKYYGYASSTGWQIKRKTLATGVWEVDAGLGDYDTNWVDRASKTYAYT
jgi:hypothetical protein